MDFFLTLQNVSVLFLLIVIGYGVGKLNIVDENGQRQLTQLILKVTMPATIILAMQIKLEQERINTMLQILLIMVICYTIITLYAYLITRRYPLKENQKDVHMVGLMLSNTSFMGYPIVLSLLGQEALFYAVIAGGLVFEIVSWTLGTMIIARTSENVEGGSNIKKALLSPGVVSIVIGMFFFLTQIPIPEPVNSTMRMLGQISSPGAMLVVGLMLSRSNIKEALQNKTLYLTSLIKLVVTPLLILLTLRALGITGIRQVIPVLMLSMPTATYVAMFSANLGNDGKMASHLVFLTSLFSVITIPIIASLVQL